MEVKDSKQQTSSEHEQKEETTEQQTHEDTPHTEDSHTKEEGNGDEEAKGKKAKDFKFKECPETSSYTQEQLHTENSKTLDPIEIGKMKKPKYSYGKRVRLAAFYQEDSDQYVDTEVKVCGWAKTLRAGGKGAFYFVDLNDGSSIKGVQVVIDQAIDGFDKLSTEGVGTSFGFVGTLIKSPAAGQKYELVVKDNSKHSITIYGSCPQGEYPLSKKKHTKEYLREIMHLRPRTNLISVVSRLRNSLSIATHEFFQKRGFLYVHTPMITASDCEGAGEMFQVTTVLPDKDLPLKEVKSTQDGKVDYSYDFFKKPAYLTVSGQLNVEGFC